jgi:hypothetical protein
MTLKFLRNKVVEVELRADGDLAVSWRLTDDLTKIEVQLVVRPPDLEIVSADAHFDRYIPLSCKNASENIKKVEGVGIGGGLRKIVAGLLGGTDGCSLIVDAVLESANAVILYFTRPGIELGESVTDPDEKLAGVRQMVKSNPRLVRSCISFQDDSPIMKDMGL